MSGSPEICPNCYSIHAPSRVCNACGYTPTRMEWFRFYCGRDWMRELGWVLHTAFILRRDLMTKRGDVGRVVLAGFDIEIAIHPRWLWRGRPIYGVSVRVRSDADEIATRLAAQ